MALRDAVIIGAGHNGLVTACYLARAGLKPLVLEARSVAGGAAVTEEFHPGFKSPRLAHNAAALSPDVVRDLQLGRHGLKLLHPEVRVFAPGGDGQSLLLYRDDARSATEMARLSQRDAEKYLEFCHTFSRIGGLVREVLSRTPPDLDGPSAGDLFALLKTGRQFRALGKQDMYRVLRWTPMAAADLVSEFFQTELLRAVAAAPGIFGNFLGPWSAGSGTILLLRAAATGHPITPAVFPQGGMGALTQALAQAAQQAGAEIRLNASVTQITVKDGLATGVVLTNGEEIAARAVISNADPKRTLLDLLDPVHLDPAVTDRLRAYRTPGTLAKVNLALDAVPKFTGLAADPAVALSGRIHIGPEIDYLERAFDDCKYGDFSRQPYLDIVIPSLSDPSLAPPGKHVMSVYVQFAPYRLKNGDWESRREELGDRVVRTIETYAPGLQVLAGEVLTPFDLEQQYGLTGGHIFHGELALDQLFTMRPLLGWARYRTPVRNLYLCGSGTHPGVGLSGLSGSNAAREILKDLR